jgi:hypothetical protein
MYQIIEGTIVAIGEVGGLVEKVEGLYSNLEICCFSEQLEQFVLFGLVECINIDVL